MPVYITFSSASAYNGNNYQHSRVAITHDAHLKALFPTPVSTAVTVTAKTTPTTLFRTRVYTATGTGGHYAILTQAYSYDGVFHIESFRSDS